MFRQYPVPTGLWYCHYFLSRPFDAFRNWLEKCVFLLEKSVNVLKTADMIIAFFNMI